MKHENSLQERQDTNGVKSWQLFGGVALVLTGLLVIVSLPDIKRYIRIKRM